jgi:FAD binding domain-containing protein
LKKLVVVVLGLGAAAGLVMASVVASRRKEQELHVASKTWRGRISSHEAFSHDSIESLGYDWSRVANPSIAAHPPLKIYLPQSIEDVIAIVKEAKQLGETIKVRSKGHSSNDLVVADRGSVLLTQKLISILEINESDMTVTVQSGTVSALLDDELATRGFGLPIIGDHAHITVGGFASVGGISPASHRFGLFVDNVVGLQYVDWDGELHACSPSKKPDHFYRVLAGLGRHGVIVTLTLRMIEIDKYRTVWKNDLSHYFDLDEFIAGSYKYILDPGDAMMERGVFADFGHLAGREMGIGQFSAYRATAPSDYKRFRQWASYGVLHSLGYVAGRLPEKIDKIVKFVGMTGVFFSPRYASIKNIEFFTDKLLDATVGDPTRMLIVLGPLHSYPTLLRELFGMLVDYREKYDCFTFVSVYVKSIHSKYLTRDGNDRFCELMFYLGTNPTGMTDKVLDEIVSDFDDRCIKFSALRYMHSRTVRDPERLAKLDPNARYMDGQGRSAWPELATPLSR